MVAESLTVFDRMEVARGVKSALSEDRG